jgi:hypothetical protein
VSAPLPLHLGAFHTYEWVLFLLLIIGPFLGLAVTIVVVRRREAREDAAAAAEVGDQPGMLPPAARSINSSM